MAKITYAALDKDIGAGVKALDDIVDSLCSRIRTDHIIPFCQKNKLDFVAGMGAWAFYYVRHRDRKKGTYSLGVMDVEKVPKSLRMLLQASYPLNNSNDIGSLIQDYRYRFVSGDEVIITVDTGRNVAGSSNIAPDLRDKVLGKVNVVGHLVHPYQPSSPGVVGAEEATVMYFGEECITVPTRMLNLY